jgi:phosphoribosyl 1,2-cyclic phosphodiesterase
VQVSTGGPEYVLIDAGTGIRDFAQSYRLRHMDAAHTRFLPGTTFHIFFSHLHWDHVQGLPFFYPIYAPGHNIIIYGAHDNMEEAVRQQFRAPFFPVPYEVLGAKISYKKLTPGESYEIAGLRLSLAEQNHPGKSFGYRFERDGRIFVYSSDCEHKQAAVAAADYPLLDLFADADLLVFDAMYSLDEATYGKADWGHSSNVMGVELAARARVKRLALFHHDPHHTDAELTEMLFDTRMCAELQHRQKNRAPQALGRFPSEVLLAYDGLEVEL